MTKDELFIGGDGWTYVESDARRFKTPTSALLAASKAVLKMRAERGMSEKDTKPSV